MELVRGGVPPQKPAGASKEAKPSFAKATEGEGGAGGSRTPVQTSDNTDFYMLILLLVFDLRLAAGSYFCGLSCEFRACVQVPHLLASNFYAPVQAAESRPPVGQPVPYSKQGIKHNLS